MVHQAARESKVSCAEVERMGLDMLARKTSRGPLAGTTVSQDRRFIDKYMPALGAWLNHRTVDTTTIKELTRRWYPEVIEERPKKN